ncbi:hypothetical protein [Algoriphagus formosus]|uniref:Uncharacterized protein n=2 Tax=Algoriphagus formosus TaxID=2007308 RepID=A0A4R5VEM1_9BACT|nr:hypothetical protein [Algoriphagus aquimaris]TDK50862.1 hypothetical protein E1898_00590 [Algoriphagus aquimaris]
MIESILIGIAANIITGVGQSALKKIVNNGSLEEEIQKAFDNALNQWTVNYGIKEKEKIFTKSRFSLLLECVKEPEKINTLEKSTADIITFFKLELQKSTTAWNFIEDIHFQTALNKLNSLELHIKELNSSFINQIKAIEKTFDDALIPYFEAFKYQLNENNNDLPNQFHNTFIGRKADLDNIDYLIKMSDKKIISVVADGGYGKTRICIEYFKQYIDNEDNYEAFVLDVSAYKSLNFANQLKSEKHIIVLVDDAHKHPNILNDIINTANRHDNVKIMLTVRKAMYEDTIKELATHNRNIGIQKIERLTYEETQELFKSQLPGLKEIEIKKLSDESKGIPIVVLGLCLVTLNGKYKSDLSEEANFKLFVRELKNQVINDIHIKYLIDKEKINKTIQLLSFFSPIKNSEEEILELSKLNDIDVGETNLLLDYLEEYEFIARKSEIYIKPDPYSDTILLDSATRIKYLLKKDIKIFIDRLIRNLVEVEQSERLDFSIDNLLLDFVSSFKNKQTDNEEGISILVSNLETLKSFTYKKPRICFLAIKDLINSKAASDEFWHKEEVHFFYTKSFKEVHENIETILSIAALNSHKVTELDDIYELLLEYKTKKVESNIFQQVFRYRVYDFFEYGYRPYSPCERQTYLINKLNDSLNDVIPELFLANHIFNSIKTLLVLEFEGESYYDKYTHAFSWGRHFVISNKTTERIRIDALNLMFKLYLLTRFEKHSEAYFDEILRILFFMAEDKREKYVFNQKAEVELVIEFLKKVLGNNPSMTERSKVIRQLKIFERREIKDEYKDTADTLLALSEHVETPKDRLTLLFLDEYFSLRKNIETILNEIIEQYSDINNFLRDIVEIKLELTQKDFTNFHEVLSHLISNYPKESKTLLDLVIENYPEQSCDFSTLIKANYKDSEYFYSTIEKIWNLEYECVKGSVLWMLTNGRNRETEYYNEDDLKYVEYVVENKMVQALWSISFTLPKYILINPQRTLSIISRIFIISENEREDGHLLHSIFEDKEILDNHSELIKDFVFNSTLEIPLDSHYLEKALNFLENYFGFELLFLYLKKKVETITKQSKYISLSYHKHYNNPEKEQLQTEKDFLKVVQWYGELESKSEYIHKALVEFLRPIQIQSEVFKTEFKKLIEECGDNIDRAVDLCSSLDVYEEKGEFLISMLIEIANELCAKYEFDNEKLIQIFGSNYIRNLGSKSGPAGGPFPQDLNKREELNQLMGKYQMHAKVKRIFDYSLERVNNDIERDRFEDEKW